jgi:hypothetical protein
MEVTPPKYSNPHLFIDWYEHNPWMLANISFAKCYQRYFKVFKNEKLLEEEAQRPDINTVCRRELQNLRAASQYLGYKDVAGYTFYKMENSLLDEVLKKYKDY